MLADSRLHDPLDKETGGWGCRGMDDVDVPGSSAYIRNPLRGLSEGSRDGCHAVVSSGLVDVSSA